MRLNIDAKVETHVNVRFLNPLVIIHETPPPPKPSQAGVWITARCDGFTLKGKCPMAFTLPDDKMINLQVAYLDARGHPATIDGDVTWASSDTMIANVGVKQGDSTQAQLIPGANLGQAQITATADADLGEGVTNVICTMDVTVVAGAAVIGTITPVGELQPFPTPPAQAGRPGQLPAGGQAQPRR